MLLAELEHIRGCGARIEYELLDGQAIQQLEPALSGRSAPRSRCTASATSILVPSRPRWPTASGDAAVSSGKESEWPALIGATRLRRVFVAGGHGMWGITLGPVTGQLLAQAIVSGALPPELAPFDPLR